MSDYSNHTPCLNFLIGSVKNYYQISIVFLFQQIEILTHFGFLPPNLQCDSKVFLTNTRSHVNITIARSSSLIIQTRIPMLYNLNTVY